MTTTKHYLFLLQLSFLGWLGAFAPVAAQNNLPIRQDITGYRSNYIESVPLALLPADTLKTITVESTNSNNLGSASTNPQPTLIRTGLSVVVYYATSSSLPQSGWYRLKVNGQTRYEGELKVGQYTIALPASAGTLFGSLTSQISALQTQLATIRANSVDLSAYTSTVTSLSTAIGGRQSTLVSGLNIKTINGSSLLGSGDLVIQGGVTSVNGQTGSVTISIPISATNNNQLTNGAGYQTAGDVSGAISAVRSLINRTYTFVLGIGSNVTSGVNVTNQITIENPGTITKAWINAKTAPTGADLIVDLKLNGTSIWAATPANRLKLVAGATTGSQTAFNTTAVTAGQLLTLDVVQVGSTVPGKYVTIQLVIAQ